MLLRQDESQAPNRAFCFDGTLEGATQRGVKFSPLLQYRRQKCSTNVQFESILLQQNESQAPNRAFCFDRTLDGASERGINFLPQTQYGRMKCVTVVQFDR